MVVTTTLGNLKRTYFAIVVTMTTRVVDPVQIQTPYFLQILINAFII